MTATARRQANEDANGHRWLIRPDLKMYALQMYAIHGPREASRRLADSEVPVSESTLSRWAKQAGVSVTQSVVNNQVARDAAIVRRQRTAAESALYLVERLQTVAEVAVERELEMVQQPGQSLRDIVGSRTRAIHDLRLLMGESTETLAASAERLDVEELARALEARAGQATEDD